ncbi:unnamed protein product [Rhizophagus irregularis]|nr:unnamed protein product [Rhizophagus irregularis]CAB4446721.1 unnamed protein product [Rhizophagus irregularis]
MGGAFFFNILILPGYLTNSGLEIRMFAELFDELGLGNSFVCLPSYLTNSDLEIRMNMKPFFVGKWNPRGLLDELYRNTNLTGKWMKWNGKCRL